MAEDSRKYGAENTCTSSNSLTKAAFSFSRARTQMAKEQEYLLRVYSTQVLLHTLLMDIFVCFSVFAILGCMDLIFKIKITIVTNNTASPAFIFH